MDRDRECFSVTRLFLLKIIPCFPVGTHTQTSPQPTVLSLSISIKETSLFVVSWQVESVGWGASVCKKATVLEKRDGVDGGESMGLNGGRDLERGRFTPPCPLRV